MNNNAHNDLMKRILSDEPLDASPEDDIKAALVRHFENKKKKVLLITGAYLLVGVAMLLTGAYMLLESTTTKFMLLALALLLIGYESTVLIKLWYWIVDNKISVVREIKRLQLRMLDTAAAEQTIPFTEPVSQNLDVSSFWDRISLKTLSRVVWAVVVGVTAIGSAIFGIWAASLDRQMATPICEYEFHVTFDADGMAAVLARIAWTYAGVTPIETVNMISESDLGDVVWHDSNGNTLPHATLKTEKGFTYTVRLPQPLFRNERLDLRAVWSMTVPVKQENGLCVFEGPAPWRSIMVAREALTLYDTWTSPGTYKETITLPGGAQFDAATPAAKMSWKDKDRFVLFYEGAATADNPEERHIAYRLPTGQE